MATAKPGSASTRPRTTAVERELTRDGVRLDQYVLIGRGPNCAIVIEQRNGGTCALLIEDDAHRLRVIEFLRERGSREFADRDVYAAARDRA
jgi:hypothetical protein